MQAVEKSIKFHNDDYYIDDVGIIQGMQTIFQKWTIKWLTFKPVTYLKKIKNYVQKKFLK